MFVPPLVRSSLILTWARARRGEAPPTGRCLFALTLAVVRSNAASVCVNQIVGNGSEQQLQRELEDVLMDPSVADGELELDLPPAAASPLTPDPLTPPPSKLEKVLPVQTAQESELNERSYRGEPASSGGGGPEPW